MSYVRVRFEIAEQASDLRNEVDLNDEQVVAFGRMLSQMTLGDMRVWATDHAQADIMCDTAIKLDAAFRSMFGLPRR